jgi:hypothetical protein
MAASGDQTFKERRPITDLRDMDELLLATEGDAGCTASAEILDAYVELELAGEDPARVYPGTAIHLRSCSDCRAEYDGLLGAGRRFADIRPE